MTEPCSLKECDKPAKTRGLCATHYQQWWRKNCNGYDREIHSLDYHVNHPWRFTSAHWQRGLTAFNGRDERAERLSSGIAEMRELLERPPIRRLREAS